MGKKQISSIGQIEFALRENTLNIDALLSKADLQPAYRSEYGCLFSGDCMDYLPFIKNEMINTVFADPPFNLGKKYGISTNDSVSDGEYLAWCRDWIFHCVRIIKPGGAFFLYNLPKWNMILGTYLMELGMTFRHWIAIEMSACMPISNRLHPSHYSLLYFTKGRPITFRKIRTPIQVCRHCNKEIKDYGGHRKALNPNGLNLKDVWTDIPPVRHWKFKSKNRKANALSTKLLDRVIEISTVENDIVLDPFGGSGTTYTCCEIKKRHWIGMEIDYAPEIVERLKTNYIKPHLNDDYIEG